MGKFVNISMNRMVTNTAFLLVGGPHLFRVILIVFLLWLIYNYSVIITYSVSCSQLSVLVNSNLKFDATVFVC